MKRLLMRCGLAIGLWAAMGITAHAGPLLQWRVRESGTTEYLTRVAYGNGVYVAIGLENLMLASNDGRNWAEVVNRPQGLHAGVAFGHGRFVRIGQTGIWLSENGWDWREHQTPLLGANNIVFSNGLFFTLGQVVHVSPDGMVWTEAAKDWDWRPSLFHMTFGNGIYAAIGTVGLIATAEDVTTWTRRHSGTTDRLFGIAHGNGVFVAVGGSGYQNGIILNSLDGIQWDPVTFTYEYLLRGVIFADGIFIALVDGDGLASSVDGVNWTTQPRITSKNPADICYAEGRFTAVGARGLIMQSEPLMRQIPPVVTPDFDAAGRAELAVYEPSSGRWIHGPLGRPALRDIAWGWQEAIPVPGDYDGDGKTDLAVYHPATGRWLIHASSTGELLEYTWGWDAAIPVPGDYDGDGKTDLAVYHPGSGFWYVFESGARRPVVRHWGFPGAIPVPGDYDGDGKTDLAVYSPETGIWHISESAADRTATYAWGWGEALPVPADFSGDGATDLAVYHPPSGNWFVFEVRAGRAWIRQWGWNEAIPVPADYDADGRADMTVYHPATGDWYVLESSTGLSHQQTLGGPGAYPAAVSPMILRVFRSYTP